MEEIEEHVNDMKSKVKKIKESNRRLEYEVGILNEEVKRKEDEIKQIKEAEGSPFVKFRELKQKAEKLKNRKDIMNEKLEDVKKKNNEILIEQDNKIHKDFIGVVVNFERIKIKKECLNEMAFEKLKIIKDELVEECRNMEIEIAKLEEEVNMEEKKIVEIMRFLDKTKEELLCN